MITDSELKMRRAVALAKREHHDTYGLAMLAIDLIDELKDLHNHAVDRGVLDCEAAGSGRCEACVMLKKAEPAEPTEEKPCKKTKKT